VEITTVSLCVWKGEGVRCSHSNLADKLIEGEIKGRWAIKASHKIKIKYKVATKEAVEPKEEITFHCMNVSG